ncbi:MAG: hypothetical protein EA342_18605 [Leptolyngbya sp. LCM1.Bin17]|nr:MAG: hypothetical protein EA342_18605 [Leptolyngbya sp. LCM1.Bin17]
MKLTTKIFSVYISDFAVELRDDQSQYFGQGRLICSQHNYENLRKFAKNLALNRAVPLQDYTQSQVQYQY